MPDIVFYEGTQAGYNKITKKDMNGIYFISDTKSIYKGDDKYGGSDIATSSSAGIIKPGLDFEIAADGTLSLYKNLVINKFSHNSGVLEKGATISSAAFNWELNKIPASITLTAGVQTNQLPIQQTGSSTITFTAPLNTTTTFTLTAQDTRKNTVSKNTSIQFLNGKYYGVSTVQSAEQITNDFIKGLTRELTTSRTGSFKVNAQNGQYIYFAIPASFGTPAFFVGGFEGGFSKVKTFNFTNSSNFSENYDIYKSTNAGLGQTTVEVR